MINFVSIVAAPAIQLVIEKGLFGKPYIRLRKLVATVGTTVFWWGRVLGYALAGHPALLKKSQLSLDNTDILCYSVGIK